MRQWHLSSDLKEIREGTLWVSEGRAEPGRERSLCKGCVRFLVLSKKSKKTCVAAEEVREVTPVRWEKNQLPYNSIGPYHDWLLFRVKWGTLFWDLTNSMVWSNLLFKRITVTAGLKTAVAGPGLN